MRKLESKVAVITGGAAGIGRATVEKFLAEGAIVSAWDINQEMGGALITALQTPDNRLEFRAVDVTDEDSVNAAIADIVKKHGQLDILINNAGITRDATLLKMEGAAFDEVIDVNLKAVFICGQAAAKQMVTQGSGVILNASSVVGLYGNFGQTNYVASKAGVIGMTQVWARELGSKGVRVNAVAPGFIATEMIKNVPEKVIQMMVKKIPMQRIGEPSEVAAAYAFLASDEASFIHGTTLSVDGGLIS
ncbi:MAG: 3-oxoacyl-ACP reductase FabG [Candidatus Marinimicrobia bacterium]|nr:3-oxoacyl-ACP reductase FabG [Candidatus Neomarinimicrobiota bacterium]